MTTFRIVTACGENASLIGEAHAAANGSWRNSIDRCDSDGNGRVFIDCDNDHADWLAAQLDDDDRVISYDRWLGE